MSGREQRLGEGGAGKRPVHLARVRIGCILAVCGGSNSPRLPMWWTVMESGFLEEGKAVSVWDAVQSFRLGSTLLSCSPLLQGISVKGDMASHVFQTSV